MPGNGGLYNPWPDSRPGMQAVAERLATVWIASWLWAVTARFCFSRRAFVRQTAWEEQRLRTIIQCWRSAVNALGPSCYF